MPFVVVVYFISHFFFSHHIMTYLKGVKSSERPRDQNEYENKNIGAVRKKVNVWERIGIRQIEIFSSSLYFTCFLTSFRELIYVH